MPIRGKTRHDPPMQKSPKGPGMFAATDSGDKPHRELLSYAMKVGSKGHIGGKRIINR